MGCAVADYDNDGNQDMLVTAYGKCTLYHNNGDGTFTDATAKTGVTWPDWTTSAVWFDYDNDGTLDLFVCSFVEFSLAKNISAATTSSGNGSTASLACSAPHRACCITTTATAPSAR